MCVGGDVYVGGRVALVAVIRLFQDDKSEQPHEVTQI